MIDLTKKICLSEMRYVVGNWRKTIGDEEAERKLEQQSANKWVNGQIIYSKSTAHSIIGATKLF